MEHTTDNVELTQKQNAPVHESGENYLETILVIGQKKGSVRSVDIAAELGFSKPSVSIALKTLRENGYVTIDSGNNVRLTDSGRMIAERIYERHTVLSACLIALGVSEETALRDACLIEHDISDESFQKLKEHLDVSRRKETL